nr:hypothetical protein Iba_chr08cCG9850 [Ipomoea batatas]
MSKADLKFQRRLRAADRRTIVAGLRTAAASRRSSKGRHRRCRNCAALFYVADLKLKERSCRTCLHCSSKRRRKNEDEAELKENIMNGALNSETF